MKLRTLACSMLGSATLLASLAVAAPAQAYVNWPGYLFDPGHSSVNGAATAITPGNAGALGPAWSAPFSPSGGFDASPVVYDGSIYIGGNNGVFYQLNEATGAVVNHLTLGTEQACDETPTTSKYGYGVVDTATVVPDPSRGPGDATVYVTGGNGTSSTGGIYLWALDAATLQPVWTTDPVTVDTEPGAVGWASPTVANGTVSVGIASGCDYPLVQGGMTTFDQATGAQVGTAYKTVPTGALGGTIWSTPASDGTSTWVATGNSDETAPASQQGDSFAIVRLQGGVAQDRYVVPSQSGTDNDFGASPTLFTGLVGGVSTPMIGDCNKNGTFYALLSQSLSSGPAWTYQLAPSGTGSLCNGGAIWDAGADQLIMGSTKAVDGSPGSIQALSPDQNAASRVIWKSDLPCAVEGVPSEDGAGVLAVVTFGCPTGVTPSLYLYNAHATVANGSGPPAPQLLDTITLGRSAFSQPAFADGDLFVATESNLMAYAPHAPADSTAPTIAGTSADGQTLNEVNGSWTSNPTSFTHQWQRCDSAGNNCTAITDQTGQTYTLTDADVGDTIRVQEWATNAVGTAGPATSTATSLVQAPPSNTVPPTIAGTATDGQTLDEANGAWTNNPTSYTYQWQRCSAGTNCIAITGATGQTYTLTDADVGDTISVQEWATNAAGTAGPATSTTTSLVQPAPAPSSPPAPLSPGLGSVTPPVGPSPALAAAAQIRGQLLRELSTPGKRASIAKLLRHGGFTFSFTPVAAGRLVIGWYAAVRGARSHRATRAALVATGQAGLTAGGRIRITIRLTRAGRRLLAAATRVRLTAKGAYTPADQSAVSATRTFTLRG